jgi:hypothetical protein
MSDLRRIENHAEMCVVINHPSTTQGERTFLGWQYDRGSGFYTALWRAIQASDFGNLMNLKKGFPSEVQAWEDYAHTEVWKHKVDRILRDHDNKKNQQKGK